MPTQQAVDNQDDFGVDLFNETCDEEALARLVDEVISVARRLFEGTLPSPVGGRMIVKVSR